MAKWFFGAPEVLNGDVVASSNHDFCTELMSDRLTYYGPRKGWQLIDFRELWKFRDLVWAFGMRDLKIRYRQTAVGIAWALIQPLLQANG